MKKILFIGGGHGLQDVLPFFIRAKYDVSAIVSTFDSGGSTGLLRQRLQLPAVGDIRRAYSGSTSADVVEIMERRDEHHPVGNLALLFLVKQCGFAQGVARYGELVGSRAQVVPVSLAPANLAIRTDTGARLTGEHHLDKPPTQLQTARVTSLSLTKKIALNPTAKKLIAAADYIIVGPGSLLGSLVPNFLVDGMTTAFDKSRATKIFVAPGRAEWGYRNDTVPHMAARFPVRFDYILQKKNARWDGKELLSEIRKLTK